MFSFSSTELNFGLHRDSSKQRPATSGNLQRTGSIMKTKKPYFVNAMESSTSALVASPGMSENPVTSPKPSEQAQINVMSNETFDPVETEKQSQLNEPSKTVTVASKLANSAWGKMP